MPICIDCRSNCDDAYALYPDSYQCKNCYLEFIQNNFFEPFGYKDDPLNYNPLDSGYFDYLKYWYNIPSNTNSDFNHTLFTILDNMERGNEISNLQIDIDQLIANNIPILVARFYHSRYLKKNDKWDLVLASKFYRKSGNPEKSIEITNIENTDPVIYSAILTTRGGAYRELKEKHINDALECAEKAVRYNQQSFQAHGLMGAVFRDLSRYNEAFNHFFQSLKIRIESFQQDEKSIQAQNNDIGKMIQNYPDHRDELIQYLLSKDPQKFEWTRTYWNLPPTPTNGVVM